MAAARASADFSSERHRLDAVADCIMAIYRIACLGMMTSRKIQPVDRAFSDWIESRPDVLAGDPVLKGTRIAVHHIAELVRLGASTSELIEDLDITPEQIDAAVAFVRHAFPARVSAP